MKSRHRVPAALGAAGLGLVLFVGTTMLSSTHYTRQHLHVKTVTNRLGGPDLLQGLLPGKEQLPHLTRHRLYEPKGLHASILAKMRPSSVCTGNMFTVLSILR
jgi:hypothetical protein